MHVFRINLRNKRFLTLIVIVGIISYIFIFYLQSLVFPKSENCVTFNDTYLRLRQKATEKLEARIDTFLYNYKLNENFVRNTTWIEVIPNVFIYAAYVDKCPSFLKVRSMFCVQFIGISTLEIIEKNTLSSNIKCAIGKNSTVITTGIAVVANLPEHHSFPFSAVFFYCKLKRILQLNSWPDNASLFINSVTSWIPLKWLHFQKSSVIQVKVSLCVRPFYGVVSRLRLAEFISYYAFMGIEHFIFYHQTVDDSLYRVIGFLKSANISIELLPWDIPLNNSMIHANGQILFSQDCIIRSRYDYSHTLIVDMDEFVALKRHDNIKDLISSLDREHRNAGSYIIPNVMFCNEFIPETKAFLPFQMASNVRQKTHWIHRYRSKYIVRPERVRIAGIHFIWKHEDDWTEVQVSQSFVQLHHYRFCCGLQQTWFLQLFSFNVLDDGYVIDNSLSDTLRQILSHMMWKLIINSTNFGNFYLFVE